MTAPEISSTPPSPPSSSIYELTIESLDLEGQGVGHNDEGKVVFVEGALPGERVRVQRQRSKKSYENAKLLELLSESSLRVKPACPHFGIEQGNCGGCKMQHLEPSAQVAIKQRVLEDNLWHLGKVKAETMLPPIAGPSWGYRYRARMSVRYVAKKGGVLVGFHERKSAYIADMRECRVLPPHVSDMLMPLRVLIASMSQPDRLPQIELAVGGGVPGQPMVTALVLRHMESLPETDRTLLRAFAAQHSTAHQLVQWWLQPKGPDTVHLLDEGGPELAYGLSEFGVRMPFKPTDFTQVNHHINDVLVGRAVRRLGVQPHERVIDWFCGLGNFTLPLSTQAREVLGIEGSEVLVARAKANAALFLNGKSAESAVKPAQAAIDFVARNLFEMTTEQLIADGRAEKWLVDPPRDGAFALFKALADWEQRRLGRGLVTEVDGQSVEAAPEPMPEHWKAWQPPERIVYVSCNPSTLARDAGLIVHQAGYRCTHAGVVNMFPHTAHVESMAVFERVVS